MTSNRVKTSIVSMGITLNVQDKITYVNNKYKVDA